MSEETKDDGLISIFIDDQEVRTKPGTNIIEVAKSIGVQIPHYCYHEKLSISGNCRMCLVEMGLPGRDRATGEAMLNPDGTPKIMFFPGPAIACGTNASPNMHIRTKTKMVTDAREGVTEFLLANHPLDCPICDQAGECTLQEQSAEHGKGYSRFIGEKNVKPKRTSLGPRVTLDDERCVLCSRCIRFCEEVVKDDVLGFVDRGSYSTLTCYSGKKLENNYSLNTVDLCPVGALTSTDFRFKMRVWFLKTTQGIDAETSVGCNTEVWSREGKIYRITPRQNDDVNDCWMPDSGRALYQEVEAENRLQTNFVDGKAASIDIALREASVLLAGNSVAIVGSGRSSVEEQYLLKELASAMGEVTVSLVSRIGEGDDLLISKDRNPNVRGALVTGLISELPKTELSDLAKSIDAGSVKTVLVVNEDLTEAGLTTEQLAKVKLIVLGTHQSATTDAANVVLAGMSVFEKSGTFVNQQFRLQKFEKAVPGPKTAMDDLIILASLLANLTNEKVVSTVDSIWDELSSKNALLEGLSYKSLPASGQLLDASSYEDLPFVEGETLHYKPVALAST
ncbi:MAG: (2Fe-2S)-binding protein [Opitutaceae bacterium]|nr:(2Fe-2S)-binding protein [Opitutaceae bacterium]